MKIASVKAPMQMIVYRHPILSERPQQGVSPVLHDGSAVSQA